LALGGTWHGRVDSTSASRFGSVAPDGLFQFGHSIREREAAKRIPEFVEYVELSGRPEFNDIFTEALTFPAHAKLLQKGNGTHDPVA
jgi:hypothetical protein